MNIDLMKFCHHSAAKEGLCAPWSAGEYTYATNGHILIRVPRLADFAENPKSPAEHCSVTGSTGKTFLLEPAAWSPVPAVDYVAAPCPACGGAKQAYMCPECEGDGEVQLSTRFNSYDEVDCLSCYGSGQLSEAGWKGFVQRHSFKGEPIVLTCNSCNGAGVADTNKSEVVNGVSINVKYLAMIGALPAAELGTFGPMDIVRYRFDGGEGLIMPMRPEKGN